MEKVLIYKPRLWTKEFHESTHRWKVIVAHRRSGKTTATLNHLIRDALCNNKAKYAFIAPTYKQAKNVAWDILKQYAIKIDGAVFNESELRADFANGSRITLYGADNPDSLRGIGLCGVVFDEYSQQPTNIFTEIIRPALADHNGYAIWIGTPKGKNEFFRLYERAANNAEWYRLLLPASYSNVLAPEELISAKKSMTAEEYEQEFECSFESAVKGAYYAKELADARKNGRITAVPYMKNLRVHTWWDLGIGDSTVIGFFQKAGLEWHMIDYYEATGEGLDHYAGVLQSKKYLYGYHFAPHDIEVRELGTGKSRKEIARTLDIDFRVVPNLPIYDGINALRMRFNTLWFDTQRCAKFLDALSMYQRKWNEQMGDYDDKPLHDWTSHAADMARYWAVTRENFDYPIQAVEQPSLRQLQELATIY